ncbi:hypothetical protein RDI58_014630 [Solanum bulbocastanum]|uniref:Pectinesterase inhibitor domain-containing protein n=1 Tax=Solanum bulbocastanum TaxID=147425 RepID=A0AAN8TFB5_SOLBU
MSKNKTMFTFSSSSPFGLTLVLCLIVSFFVTPSTSNHLSYVCIKSKSPRFCLQVLGLNPHRSTYELTREAINLTLANAFETTEKIHIFINQTNDQNLKKIYEYCLSFYQDIIRNLKDAEEHFLKEGPNFGVSAAGNIAQLHSYQCEIAFQRNVGYIYDSPLIKDTKNLVIFGSIVVSAVNLLYNSTLI